MSDCNKLAAWMIAHGLVTGHGDTTDDLLAELGPQIDRLRAEVASSIKRSMKDAADSVISDSAIENAVEKAYWQFDARRKGYAEWATMPQSERDAFKAEGRMLAKGFYPVGKSFVEAERDALRTLLREARPYVEQDDSGLSRKGKIDMEMLDRIDAALGGRIENE